VSLLKVDTIFQRSQITFTCTPHIERSKRTKKTRGLSYCLTSKSSLLFLSQGLTALVLMVHVIVESERVVLAE